MKINNDFWRVRISGQYGVMILTSKELFELCEAISTENCVAI